MPRFSLLRLLAVDHRDYGAHRAEVGERDVVRIDIDVVLLLEEVDQHHRAHRVEDFGLEEVPVVADLNVGLGAQKLLEGETV